MRMGVDIETYSSVDIKEAGAYAYAQAPDFEILLIAYKIDEFPVVVIDLTDPLTDMETDHPKFWEALFDPAVCKTAFNANFERTCLSAWLKQPMPAQQWSCTAVLSATLGIPGSLGAVCTALGLPEDAKKSSTGKKLIEYFCKPCKPTKANGGRTRNLPEHAPDKWDRFVEYNRQDVVAESTVREKLGLYQVPEEEQELWVLDQQVNDRGVRLDMDLAEKIMRYDEAYTTRLLQEAREWTGLENPNSLPQLKQWFKATYGLEVKSITKDTMAVIQKDLDLLVAEGDIRPEDAEAGSRMLQIRQELGKTSTKKYHAMKNAVCPDGYLRGTLQFYGANRTGRWAGRIVQVHNLPQNKLPDIDYARELVKEQDFESLEMLFPGAPFVFSQLIRTAFLPSDGCRFVVSDFSAIEARVIAWLAGEEWRMEVFRTHGRIYEASASQMFHVPIENIKKGSRLRQQGKIAELALGYGGAFGAIKAMDKEGSIPEEEIPLLVSNWRRANPKICSFWKKCETAARTAMEEHRTVKLPLGLSFFYRNGILFIGLPSGRDLAYYDARLEKGEKGPCITYAGVDDTKRWGRLDTWGGKLVENIVQAVARDCLAESMKRVAARGYQIAMHVHDELVVDVPISEESALDTITGIMSEPIGWAPGLPLRGDGYECGFYKKD